jgi:hypothetical protein
MWPVNSFWCLRFFNKTDYSGLETHILNSYTNALLQVLHYSTPVRRLAKSHITTNCLREHCLLCELGFVVRMLEDACGTNCQASNFCKTLGVLALGECLDHVGGSTGLSDEEYSRQLQMP